MQKSDSLLGMDPAEARDLYLLRPPARSFPLRPGRCEPTVLFLDFDGVLHSVAGHQYFAHLDRLEALLIDFPDVSVVLSTSWQSLATFDHLKGVLAPALRERIEGGTAQLAPAGFAAREALAAAWMSSYGRGRRWISLDDDHLAFRYRSQNLLWCMDRYGDEEDALLRAWLVEDRPIQDLIADSVGGDPTRWSARGAAAQVRAIVDARGEEVIRSSDLPQFFRDALLPNEPDRQDESYFRLADWRNRLHQWFESGKLARQENERDD